MLRSLIVILLLFSSVAMGEPFATTGPDKQLPNTHCGIYYNKIYIKDVPVVAGVCNIDLADTKPGLTIVDASGLLISGTSRQESTKRSNPISVNKTLYSGKYWLYTFSYSKLCKGNTCLPI